jgi:hypothetical protein
VGQLRFDGGEDENPPQPVRFRTVRPRLGERPDLDEVVNECVREGIFRWEDSPKMAREAWRKRVAGVARGLHEKNGAPSYVPAKEQETDPQHVLVHIEAATSEERWSNVIRRGRQLFGAYFRAHASRDDMLGRLEKAPRLPEFKPGWRVIRDSYALEPGAEDDEAAE